MKKLNVLCEKDSLVHYFGQLSMEKSCSLKNVNTDYCLTK